VKIGSSSPSGSALPLIEQANSSIRAVPPSSGEDVVDDAAVDVGEAELAAGVLVG
jgi:hypothetical protein